MAQDQSMSVKLATLAVSASAGWLAQKAVTALWTKATGHTPATVDDDDATLVSVVTFAAVTGAVAALTKVLASRGTRRVAHRMTARKALAA